MSHMKLMVLSGELLSFLPRRTQGKIVRYSGHQVTRIQAPLRQNLELALCVSNPGDRVALKFIGIGKGSVNFIEQLKAFIVENGLPAAKGAAHFACVDLQEHTFSRNHIPLEVQYPDIVVIVAGSDAETCIDDARILVQYAAAKNVLTTLLVSQHLRQKCAADSTSADLTIAVQESLFYQAALAVTAKLLFPGLICLDLVDFRATIDSGRHSQGLGNRCANGGLGFGTDAGRRRALRAADAAISSMSCGLEMLRHVTGAFVTIRGGADLRLQELETVKEVVRKALPSGATIRSGDYFDNHSDDTFEVSVICVLPRER